jgi:putative transposase
MDHEPADREVRAAAERRAATLIKLSERPTKAEVRAACAVLDLNRATLFRWLKRYRRRPGPAPCFRGGGARRRAGAPLPPEVLGVVERHFQDLYATRRWPSASERRPVSRTRAPSLRNSDSESHKTLLPTGGHGR